MSNAKDFVIDNGILKEYIGSECTVEIPAGVKVIAGSAFDDCGGLCEVVIPDGVEKICANAFFNCTSLSAAQIPDSVTEIEDSAFDISDFFMAIYASEGSEAERYAKENGVTFNAPSKRALGGYEKAPAPAAPPFKVTWNYDPKDSNLDPELEYYAVGCFIDKAIPNVLALRLKALREEHGVSPEEFETQSLLQVARMHGLDVSESNVLLCRERLYRVWFDTCCEVCGKEPSSRIADAAQLLLEKGIICAKNSEVGASISCYVDVGIEERYDSLKATDAAGRAILFPLWKLTDDNQFIRYDADVCYSMGDYLETIEVESPILADEEMEPGSFEFTSVCNWIPDMDFTAYFDEFGYVREYPPCRISNLRAVHEDY